MFVDSKVDYWGNNSVLDVATILYKYVYIDKRYSERKKLMYKKRLLKWIRKHNIPLELIIERF